MLTGDASSASALQTLAVLAMSPCSQPTSKQSMSSLRALGPLPVGIDGYAGVVVGNLVIAASVALVQLVVIRLLMSSKRVGSFAEGCEKCRAPSMTIAAFFSFYQGTFYAASQLMARPGMDDGERGGGAVAFVFVFAAPFAVVWLCRTQLPRMCIAYEYQRSRLYHQLYAGPVAYVMLPQSRIEPAHLRRRFSTLVASYCKPHDLLPVLPVSIPFLLSILALWNPESNGECMTFFILALVIHVAVCIGVLVLRPFRLRYDLPLFSCGIAVNAAFVVLSIFALQDPRFLAPVVTFALLVVQIILQVVKMMLRLWNLRLEELLEAVPTYQTWVIGCSESADVKCGQVFSECDDNDVMNLLALTLMDGEGYGRHHYEDPTEDDNNPHSQLLQLLPIHTSASHHAATTASSYEERGASHSAAAAAAGDDTSSDGNELVMALGSLSKVDEELNLHDELRLWRSRDRTR
ncbi:DGF-1-like protein, putative [Bodo saltans]|uniref:DGF-1-like protein, putative n=1 Tax=Bodo saltans TaxID=75058 RepID=A0A0S4JA07_BODSA|nr:DGF-1-like protein, putative [Bodo saltans]|eukprot:CUG86943.1 DGF-1-like protein, putative [Bodo saltans]